MTQLIRVQSAGQADAHFSGTSLAAAERIFLDWLAENRDAVCEEGTAGDLADLLRRLSADLR